MSFLWLFLCFLSYRRISCLNETYPDCSPPEVSTDLENALLRSFLSATILGKNYIFVGVGQETACTNSTCEKFVPCNLATRLEMRGKALTINEMDHISNFKDMVYKNEGSRVDDVFVLKFTVFTSKEIENLNIVRSFSSRGFVVVICNDISTFQSLKAHVLKKEIFNIFLLQADENAGVYFMYEVCAYCQNGKHEIKIYNSWKFGRGFLKPLQYLSSFKDSFYGATINVGLRLLDPNAFIVGKTPDGRNIYAGNDYWIVETVSQYLNFEMNIMMPTDGTTCKSRQGGFGGYCKWLLEKEVQLAGFPVNIDYVTNLFFDPTVVYYQVRTVITSAYPPLKKQWASAIDSLKDILLYVFISMIVVTLVLWAISKFYKDQSKNSLADHFFDTFAILCFKGIVCAEMRSSQQIALGVWMFCCLFVISSVFGEITSVAAKPEPARKLINSIEDMKEQNVDWIQNTFFPIDYILRVKLPEKASTSLRMTPKDGLEFVLENPLEYVYFHSRVGINNFIRLFFWDGKGRSPFHISPAVSGDAPFLITVLLRKDAPFKKSVELKLLQLEASGLLKDKFMPDAIDLMSRGIKIDSKYTPEETAIGFTMDNMIAILILIGGLQAVTLLFFALECFFPIIVPKKY